MSVMTTRPRTVDDLGPTRAFELGVGQARMPGSDQHAVVALTVLEQTGEIMAVCTCALLGVGTDETAARADLSDAHLSS